MARHISNARRALSRLTAVLLVVVLAGVVALLIRVNQPPFDLAKLDRLVVGMSGDQVRGLLGEPSNATMPAWNYSAWLAWPIVTIYFDDLGGYSSHHYDY